jgi:two-component system, cell cycle sensor histidine kinase and response regulator CckA
MTSNHFVRKRRNCSVDSSPSIPEVGLREDDASFRILFINHPQPMWVYDLKTLQFLEVNDAATQRFGYSRDEFLAMRITDIRPPEDVPMLLEDVANARRGLQHFILRRHTLKNGTVTDVEITSHSLTFHGQEAELVVVHDVTSRNWTERQLHESEDRYRALVSGVKDYAIFMISASGDVMNWNEGAKRIKGYEASEIIGHHFSCFYPPEDVQAGKPEKGMREALAEGHYEDEGWRLRKDGTRFWAAIALTPVRNQNGELQGFSKITRDTTDRRMTQEAVTLAERKYREIFEEAIVGIFQTTPDGKLLSANPAMATLYGYASSEEMSESVTDVRTQLYVDPQRRDEFKRLLRETGGVRNFEVEVYRKDGSKIWVAANARAVLEDGLIVRYEGTFEDINQRRFLEKQLALAEQSYRGIFENAVVGIFQSTPAGRYQTVNRAMAKMLGYDSPEDLMTSITDIGRQVYVDPLRRDQFQELLKQGGVAHDFEIQAYRKDGSKMWLSASGRAILRDGTIIGYEGMNEDITERRLLEDQLRQAQKMEAVGRLAGGVAHDFNNMLGVITGYGELLQLNLPPRSPLRKYADEIGKAGRRATTLTRQLLAFSRKQVISPLVLDLNAVVSEMETMMCRLIGEDIQVSFKRQPALAPVRIDPGQVEQILMNLAINSRDAMPDGGSLCIEVAETELDETYARQIAYAKPGRYVMLTVSDTGCGIDKEIQPHIFEPFFTTKEVGKGTGLGLSTVYGIVKQNEGYIRIYSEPAKGTTFKIYFPRADAAVSTSRPIENLTLPPGAEVILVVEDEAPLRKLAHTCLESHGYTILEAANAATATELFQQHGGEIDLLLTDLVMPGESGRALAERLLAFRPTLKVLYMSGYTSDLIAQQGILNPGILLLEKPFTLQALLAKVREALHPAQIGKGAGIS